MVRLIHHVRKRLVLAVLFALLVPAGVAAQDAVVTRNVNLRQDPSTTQSPIHLLLPGAELRLLEPDKSNNYYHVATMGGEEGWVWGNNVRLLPPPPGPAEVFNGCPMEGNASREDFRALNRLKNRTTTPAASDMNASITLPAMLQSGDDESRWSESQGATVTGYVYDVKPGGEESVNCGATKVADKDTHIEMTLSSTDAGARRRVIVEVTPKWRAYEAQLGQNWSTADLRSTFESKCAEVTGWLLWDKAHKSDAENTNPAGAGNWRATAWEIHPVTQLRVVACSS